MKDGETIGLLSEALPAAGVIREVAPSYNYDFHIAQQKQHMLLLDEKIEVETLPGDLRRFKAGEVLLMEITEGKGYRIKNTTASGRRSVFVALP